MFRSDGMTIFHSGPAINLALAEDFVGRLDIVLESGLRVMREEKRLMGASHFIPFVTYGLEIVGQKSDRILWTILYNLTESMKSLNTTEQ